MSNMNPNGVITPRVFLYDSGGNIIYSKFGRPLGLEVSDFVYEEDEENDDSCRITIETSDYTVPDLPSLKADVIIYVQWGYEDGKMSPKRQLAIRDTSTSYSGSAPISHVLICTDKASYLKTIRVERESLTGFADWLSQISKSVKGVSVTVEAPITNRTLWVDLGVEPSYLNEVTGNITAAVDNTAVAKTYDMNPIISAGGSVWKTLREEVDTFEDGPYVMDGREDNLNIRKRDFNAKAVRSYNIGSEKGDDVISFNPESDIKLTEMESANYTNVNSADGSQDVENQVNFNFDSAKNQQYYESLDPYDQQTFLLVQGLEKAYETSKATGEQLDPAAWLAGQWENIGDINTTTPAYVAPKTANISMAVDNTAVIIKAVSIPRAIYWNGDRAKEIMENMIANEVLDNHYKKFRGTLEIQMDPKLGVNKNIYISGRVAKTHKGKYYISKVVHRIPKVGPATTTLSLFKEPKDLQVIKATYTKNLDANDFSFDFSKYYGHKTSTESEEEKAKIVTDSQINIPVVDGKKDYQSVKYEILREVGSDIKKYRREE